MTDDHIWIAACWNDDCDFRQKFSCAQDAYRAARDHITECSAPEERLLQAIFNSSHEVIVIEGRIIKA